MASRDQQKQRARAEREARAADDALRDRRARRLRMLAIALAAAVAVVVIAIVVSSRTDEGRPGGGQQSGQVAGVLEVQRRFDGIPQDGFVLGRKDAPVTLLDFSDLQCPFCRQVTVGPLSTVIGSRVRNGQVRLEFRNFAILGPDSEKAARAAAAAAEQDRAWQFIDLWYLNQGEEHSGYVTDEFIRRIASAVPGLDAERVVAASNDPSFDDTLREANTEAQRYGIDSTPSFLIGRTGGALEPLQLRTVDDPAPFLQAIDRLLGAPAGGD